MEMMCDNVKVAYLSAYFNKQRKLID